MSRRIAIPIAPQRQDVDERMMSALAPDGTTRRIVNARFRRHGGLESCPGWSADGPMDEYSVDSATLKLLAPVEHGGLRVASSHSLLWRRYASTYPTRLYPIGDLSQLTAPRRYQVASGSQVVPFGCCSDSTNVYAVYRDSNGFWFSRLRKNGVRLVSEGDFKIDQNGTLGLVSDDVAIACQDGTSYVWMVTDSGIARLQMSLNITSVYGGTPTYAESLTALGGPGVASTYVLYEATYGRIGLLIPDHPTAPTVETIITDMDTTPSGREKWSACLGTTTDGTACLFVAYKHTSGNWRVRAFRTSDRVLVGTYSSSPIAYTQPISIGPRLDQGSNGIYCFRPTVSTTTPNVFALTVSDAGVWAYYGGSWKSQLDNAVVRWDRVDPIVSWTQSGSLSMIVLANHSSPIYDRGYVLSARMASTAVEPCVESVIAPGEVHRVYDDLTDFGGRMSFDWANTAVSVDSDGIFRALLPMLDAAYPGADYPSNVALFQWRPSSLDEDSEGAAVNCRAGGLTLFAGGLVAAYDGERCVDIGFSAGIPELTALAESGIAGTLNGSYKYVVLWRWTDATGAVHYSAPSKVYSIAVTNTQWISITIGRRAVPSGMRDVQALVYRTEASGVTYYETKLTLPGYAITSDGPGSVSITGTSDVIVYDGVPDADLISRPILYTQGETGSLGGQLPYAPPPPCRSIAASPTRVLCGGLEDVNEVQWSHEFFPGEPPVWSDFDGLRMRMPDEVIAVAWGGSQWLIFGSSKVWAVSGEGPDVSGSGQFSQVIEVQSPTGAHSPLAVASTTVGVVFQGSDSKLYAITPGSIVASPIGPPVWYSLYDASQDGDWVRSIIEVDRDGVRTIIVHTGSVRLCFDVEKRAWTTETIDMLGRAAVVDGAPYWVGENAGSIYLATESAVAAYPSWATQQDVIVELGRLFPFGQDGYGRLRKVIPLLSASNGGGLTLTDQDDSTTITMSGSVGSDFEGADGNAWARWEWGIPRQKRSSLQLKVELEGLGGWRIHAIALDVDPIKGGQRRSSGDGASVGSPWDVEFEGEFGY